MTAVPPEKSGGASALNQITRQSGQALGIALLGGIATVGFQSRFSQSADSIPGVTPEQLQGADASLSAAVHLADTVPAESHQSLMEVAGSAYLYGMKIALILAAVLAFSGAIFAVRSIPHRITHAGDVEESWDEEDDFAK